jgi:transglutaminase-like putative cysteine protease
MFETTGMARTPTGGWRVNVEHRTTFRYDGEVRSSYNEARITPRTTTTQTTLDATVELSAGAAAWRYTDYWGTTVTAFDTHSAHNELQVVGRSVVETAAICPPPADIAWEILSDPDSRDRFIELLVPTTRTAVDAEVAARAKELAAGNSPLGTAQAVADWVRGTVNYLPGATGVQTNAMEAYHERAGVCQDLAHLTLGMLRSVGIPARYVSGYLHPVVDAPVGIPAEGQSHAWVEWWTGEWCAFDPTNGIFADRRHVLVARGRDYGDVAPLKGIYHGAPSTTLEVSVTITRQA